MEIVEQVQDHSASKERENSKRKAPPSPYETLTHAVERFLDDHPHDHSDKLLAALPKRWSSYPPMILLPQSTFSTHEWQDYLPALSSDERLLLFAEMARSLKVTHLAINAPIQSNTIRSPHITPLYGDFGSLVEGQPTSKEFDEAFWTTCKQNRINQTWAPMYTMFSRGNVTEKERIFTFPDVKDQEVADLYVGVGYFAFSYLKAGAKRVWGWDLNPWSVEGLRRGSEMNGWSCAVDPQNVGGTKVVVYNEDNALASKRLEKAGVKVKHINLGLLPSSRDSWKIAASVLDDAGGWIHVHGNCRDSEIDDWSLGVTSEFRTLFGESWVINVSGTFRVKEYAPAIGHWVLDVECNRPMSVDK